MANKPILRNPTGFRAHLLELHSLFGDVVYRTAAGDTGNFNNRLTDPDLARLAQAQAQLADLICNARIQPKALDTAYLERLQAHPVEDLHKAVRRFRVIAGGAS